MSVRHKDHTRLLTNLELADIRNRENREGHPYSDTDMLLDHIELTHPCAPSDSRATLPPSPTRTGDRDSAWKPRPEGLSP